MYSMTSYKWPPFIPEIYQQQVNIDLTFNPPSGFLFIAIYVRWAPVHKWYFPSKSYGPVKQAWLWHTSVFYLCKYFVHDWCYSHMQWYQWVWNVINNFEFYLWVSHNLDFQWITIIRTLTHWGWMKHICGSKLIIIVSDNGLLLGRCQAILWTNDRILSTKPLGTYFREILIKIHTFPFKKIYLKMLSVKLWPFCLSLNVLVHRMAAVASRFVLKLPLAH